MTSRILPRDEWPRLIGTELETVWPVLPDEARVLVLEDGDQIVACWSIFPLWHVEGVWIRPEYRGRANVVFRLLGGMRRLARSLGARAVNTAATSADVAAILQKLGAEELKARHFSLAVDLPTHQDR